MVFCCFIHVDFVSSWISIRLRSVCLVCWVTNKFVLEIKNQQNIQNKDFFTVKLYTSCSIFIWLWVADRSKTGFRKKKTKNSQSWISSELYAEFSVTLKRAEMSFDLEYDYDESLKRQGHQQSDVDALRSMVSECDVVPDSISDKQVWSI